MEEFFETPLRYWTPAEATVSQVTTTAQWPPSFMAVGHAGGLRGWRPSSESKAAQIEFEPLQALVQADGVRYVACATAGDCFVAADCSPSGRISVWDCATWQRKQVLKADSAVVSLALDKDYLAAGTAAGYVRVWKRANSAEFTILFEPDLQLDSQLLYNVVLTRLTRQGSGGGSSASECLLVVHSMGKNRIGVWRLETGKLLHTLGMAADPSDATAVVAANVLHACAVQELLALVSWMPGAQRTVLQVVDMAQRQGSMLEPDDRMQHGQPLAADFDGSLLAVGHADGALCCYCGQTWTGWHQGAVGAVKCLPRRQQVVSGGADGVLKLWSAQGGLVAALQLGFPITALAVGDVHVLVGGAKSQLQIVILAADQRAAPASAADAQAMATPDGPVQQYSPWLDTRQVVADLSDLPGLAKVAGPAAEHAQAFEQFVPPRRYFTPDAALAASAPQGKGGQQEAAAGTAEGGGSEGSKFDPKAALKGANGAGKSREEEVPAPAATAEEAAEARRAQQRAMGEAPGVARCVNVELDSSTSKVGRKCDNASCLARWGLGGLEFKRCGGCKQAFYCSAHCQRTHWRDGHATACSKLKTQYEAELKALSLQNS